MSDGPTRQVDESARQASVPLMEIAEWRNEFGVYAGVTTSSGGFNLDLNSPEPAGAVTSRWLEFFAAMRPGFSGFVMSFQAHRADVVTYGAGTHGWVIGEGIDGHATTDPGVLLMITVADCIPIYLLHPATNSLALLHAGWRGVAGGILERGLGRVAELGGDPRASEIVMHCGVGICGSCYEVGPEVLHRVTGRASGEHQALDLRGELVARARRAGVEHISTSGWCSRHDEAQFFSHRRAGKTEGRMVAYLGRPRG